MKYSFGTISITDTAKNNIMKLLDSGKLSSGIYVQELERKFAGIIGVREVVAVSSGTDAIALALAVLYDFGVKRGDEVIVSALSFVATGNAVLHAGLKPVFVDIKKETLNIDVDKIEMAITDNTRVIIAVHLMGKPAEMDRINTIAQKHNLYVIEDVAEAHGAKYKGKNVGTLGDMAAYSLYVARIISTVEGGMVGANRTDFADILRSLRCHGRFCNCKQCVLNTGNGLCSKRFKQGKDMRFVFERVGYSSKMNELEAAIGIGSLEIYSEILEKRRKNLVYLIKESSRFAPYLTTITEQDYEQIGPHGFPVVVEKEAGFSRDELVDYLRKHGVDSRSLFASMPTQCDGFAFLGYRLG